MHDCVLWTGRTRTSFARPEPRRRRGPRCAGMLPPIGARPCRATDRKIAVLPPVNRSTQSPREPGRVGMARLRTGHRWYGGGRIPPHVARPLPAHRGYGSTSKARISADPVGFRHGVAVAGLSACATVRSTGSQSGKAKVATLPGKGVSAGLMDS
jgi:hypothetical protein